MTIEADSERAGGADEPASSSGGHPTKGRMSRGRRGFLGALVAGSMAGASAIFGQSKKSRATIWLRPPGVRDEDDFLDKCTRCFRCVEACPNDCLKVHGLDQGLQNVFTPYIKARTRGCILCGECADVCPTGALTPFEESREGWLDGVAMGTARVNTDLCYSYHGRTCGACYRACPLAGQAMKIGVFETPMVQPENCVGCGLCEQACLHLPQAIRVIPKRMTKGSARRQAKALRIVDNDEAR